MKRSFYILALFFLLTACSNKPTVNIDFNPKTNFEQLVSFQYPPNTDISVDSNPIMIHRIQSAIDHNLLARGLIKNDFIDNNSADITIKVKFSEQEKESNSSFSIGLGTARMGGSSRSSIGVNTSIPIDSNADIVTKITIDMSDASQAIWHGSDSYESDADMSSEQIDRAVSATVNALLDQFPPEKIKE